SRTEPEAGFGYDRRSELPGELCRLVGGAVVGDDRAVARGHPAEHPRQRLRLVEHREDDVGHERHARWGSLRISNASAKRLLARVPSGRWRHARRSAPWVCAAGSPAGTRAGFRTSSRPAWPQPSQRASWRARAATPAALAPRLVDRPRSPLAFAAGAFALGLALRLALAAARGGPERWYVVFGTDPEAAHEYLPALPALGLGLQPFLDRFAELAPSLPTHPSG